MQSGNVIAHTVDKGGKKITEWKEKGNNTKCLISHKHFQTMHYVMLHMMDIERR